MYRSIYLIFPMLLLLVTSCASLKLDPPSPDKQAILVLPVKVADTSTATSHAFYYIYEIVRDIDEVVTDTSINPYKAIFKLPIKGDMLIVDSLPPGNYFVNKFEIKSVQRSGFTLGNNVQPRNDKFKLESGKITVFSKSLNVSMKNMGSAGIVIKYDHSMMTVTDTQKEEVLTTLKKLPNFETWDVLGN